jgi:nucleoside-diphosphate kinase
MSQVERTFAIVKPDAVAAGHTGAILAEIEKAGFKIVGMRRTKLTKAEAEGFYYVHRERGFFGELVEFMSEGPLVLLALERENAVKAWRDLMGATDPGKAADGTMRKKFGSNVGRNATHGSDAAETAAFELGYFFAGMELI